MVGKGAVRRKPIVEIVDPSYQPSKAEKEEVFDVQRMTLEEAAGRVTASVEVRRTARPRKRR